MNDGNTPEFDYDGPTVPNTGSAAQVFIQLVVKRLRDSVEHLEAIGDYYDELGDSEQLLAWIGIEDRARELLGPCNDLVRFAVAQRLRRQAIEDAK